MVAMTFGRRDALYNGLQNVLDADAVFGAGHDAVALLDDQQLFNLAHDAFGVGSGQIDLVDDRNDRQIVLEREVIVCQRLRFDALRGVDDQQRALAGRE